MKAIPFEKKDDARAALECMRRETETLIEHIKLMAKFRRARFDALVNEGFSEHEALELCKGKVFE